jgi:hypothetical protein
MPVKNEAEVKLVFNEKGYLASILDKNNKKIKPNKRVPGDPGCSCPTGKRAVLINGNCYCI